MLKKNACTFILQVQDPLGLLLLSEWAITPIGTTCFEK